MENYKIELLQKPHYIKLAEDIDSFDVFCVIEHEFDNCFLLESLGEESYISRFSVIGFDPEQIIVANHNLIEVRDRKNEILFSKEVNNPYYALREMVPQDIISRGYAGGLVGYLGYDSVNYFEPTLKIKNHDKFDQFRFGVFKDGLLYDKMTGVVLYFYYDISRFDEIQKLIQTAQKKGSVLGNLQVTLVGDTLSEAQHREAVLRVKDDIVKGYIFQCEVGFKTVYKITGDSLQIYRKLRKMNPSPHMYYIKFGQQKIIGASPELLFRLRQGEMETYPLAGTIRRGKSAAEDVQLARKLLNDPKEIAEHNMLVDLHRNDIGRVAEFGTVKVRNLMDVKRYSHVQHISSEIVGIMAHGEDMFSALASNFPAGTLTGAPKIEAMKIINEIEPDGRGPYGGAVGHFGFNGDCIFAIPIRTIFMADDHAYVQTCGGIVYDSVPSNEYEEIQRKLAATKNTLQEFI